MTCTHEDNVTYYDIRANWTDPKHNEQYHAVDIQCTTCELTGVQIEVLDTDDNEYRFVAEYWNDK